MRASRLVLREKSAATGYIALRCPAARKPWVSIHGHLLGGAKQRFTERHRRAPVPGCIWVDQFHSFSVVRYGSRI
jgi:hypothetical protein